MSFAPFMEMATLRVHRTAKDLAPIDTGRLYESILREPLYGDWENGGRVFTSTEYAIHQEIGTSRMKAANNGMGYMGLARDLEKDTIERELKSYIKEQLAIIANK